MLLLLFQIKLCFAMGNYRLENVIVMWKRNEAILAKLKNSMYIYNSSNR